MNNCSSQISVLLISLLPLGLLPAADTSILLLEKCPDTSISVPVVYWPETTDNPRPLRIHHLRIDLRNRDYEVFTMVSDDPDGRGPADARLEQPQSMAERNNSLAAVNANGFQSLGSNKSETDNNWFEGRPIHIVGLVVTNTIMRNKSVPGHFSFWLDAGNNPHLGIPEPGDFIKEAVCDWSGLLVHRGKIIATSREKLHPRTLLGFDQSKRWLMLIVVDGRQPEVSEGINLYEAAELMKQNGCYEAIAFDGGGSSIMLARDPESQALRTLNTPSEGKPRPIPVMLGIRKRTAAIR